MIRAFWIDTDYDQANASDGVSRYGAYVRDRADRVAEAWRDRYGDEQVDAAAFAAAVWAVATGPIMAPGYVRSHGRVLSARLECSSWDGSLTGQVALITPWPAKLAGSRDWQRGQYWWDWPTEPDWGSDGYRYFEPSEQDISRAPHLTTRSTLAFTVPTDRFPALPAREPEAAELVALAQHTVANLITALNTVVSPVIEVLER